MSEVKGVYVLVISVNSDIKIDVGALGKIDFEKGVYAYVGSAQNGLEKRIERHLRKAKRKFWHIDYLLDADKVKVLQIFHKKGEKSEECKIAEKISQKGIPIRKLGSSDCRCKSHLFQVDDYDFLREFMHEITHRYGKRGL
jgi:Uri superfamily endonuclease